jgi:cell division protein FtsB
VKEVEKLEGEKAALEKEIAELQSGTDIRPLLHDISKKVIKGIISRVWGGCRWF